MLRILSAYGRAARMRSCALRILLTETISMALVILRVFSTDLILVRISFPTAMAGSLRARFLEGRDRVRQLFLGRLVHRAVVLELRQQRGVARAQVLVQPV